MKLDKFQSMAVKKEGKSILVVAPPGSGKTSVILNKVNHCISKEGINYKNIMKYSLQKIRNITSLLLLNKKMFI